MSLLLSEKDKKGHRVWILLVNAVIQKHLNAKCINIHWIRIGIQDSHHSQKNLIHSRSQKQALPFSLFSLSPNKTGYPCCSHPCSAAGTRKAQPQPSLAIQLATWGQATHLIHSLLVNTHVLKYLMQKHQTILWSERWDLKGRRLGRNRAAACCWAVYIADYQWFCSSLWLWWLFHLFAGFPL